MGAAQPDPVSWHRVTPQPWVASSWELLAAFCILHFAGLAECSQRALVAWEPQVSPQFCIPPLAGDPIPASRRGRGKLLPIPSPPHFISCF